MSNRNEIIFAKFPVIETKRLVLREIVEEDANDIFSYYNDMELTKYLDWNGPTSVEDTKKRIDNWKKGFNEKRLIRWGIALNNDNHLIGTVICNAVYADLADHGEYHCPPIEIGYELSKSQWGKGIMTEALETVIVYIFEKTETCRIQATVCPDNIASLKVLKKLGFFVEGYLRSYIYHLGKKQFNDTVMLSLLKKEFSRDRFYTKF